MAEMNKDLISIIIPVYNSADYLERCLDSVLSQTEENFEIILIENGSQDRSEEICRKYAEKDARIRFMCMDNQGISAARNRGIKEASGSMVSFVDSDDFIENDYCEGLKELLLSTGANLACGAIKDVYNRSEVSRKEDGKTYIYSPSEALSEMLKGKMINGSLTCKLYRKELFDGKSFPVGLTYEDAYLLPDLILDAGTIAVTERTYYTYWHREDSITTVAFSERALDAITSYEHVYETVSTRCPECLPEAQFRLDWAYFTVLDRMLVTENYKELKDYDRVVSYLKKNAGRISKSPYFEKTRRIAARALKAGVPFYRQLLKAHKQRTGANE